MNRSESMKRYICTLTLLLAVAAIAHAGPLALDIVPGVNIATNGQWSLGWSFEVTAPITVLSVDFFDDYGNGLAESHDVGIWNSSQVLLVSGTVLPSDPLVGSAPWREHAVTPTELMPGIYYIAAETGSENYTWSPVILATIPQITYLNSQFERSTTLVFPGASSSDIGYFGPSFNVGVPEPSTLGLFAAGLLIAGLVRRRR